MGYYLAGFDVVGVDIEPQPNYPFEYVMADALRVLPLIQASTFDLIHASPPCQHSAAITKGTNARRRHLHPNLYPATKALLERTGKPYVIENPDSRPDLVLCGEMFGLGVLRHRKFELGNWPATAPKHVPHRGRVRGWRHGVYYDGPYIAAYGRGGAKGTLPKCSSLWVSTGPTATKSWWRCCRRLIRSGSASDSVSGRLSRRLWAAFFMPGPRATKRGMHMSETPQELLTPAEVATLFRVDPKTVTRWAQAGKLTSIRTLGGHRRYSRAQVMALLGGESA